MNPYIKNLTIHDTKNEVNDLVNYASGSFVMAKPYYAVYRCVFTIGTPDGICKNDILKLIEDPIEYAKKILFTGKVTVTFSNMGNTLRYGQTSAKYEKGFVAQFKTCPQRSAHYTVFLDQNRIRNVGPSYKHSNYMGELLSFVSSENEILTIYLNARPDTDFGIHQFFKNPIILAQHNCPSAIVYDGRQRINGYPLPLRDLTFYISGKKFTKTDIASDEIDILRFEMEIGEK